MQPNLQIKEIQINKKNYLKKYHNTCLALVFLAKKFER